MFYMHSKCIYKSSLLYYYIINNVFCHQIYLFVLNFIKRVATTNKGIYGEKHQYSKIHQDD